MAAGAAGRTGVVSVMKEKEPRKNFQLGLLLHRE
jgi:hypothetical protein